MPSGNSFYQHGAVIEKALALVVASLVSLGPGSVRKFSDSYHSILWEYVGKVIP